MKTIELKLYEFDELSPEAKERAVKDLTHEAYEACAEVDWQNEAEAEKKFLAIADVTLQIEQSSQGFYCRYARSTNPEDRDFTDVENLKRLQEAIEDGDWEWNGDWAEHLFYEKCTDYVPNGNKSYASYVADIVIAVCEQVYRDSIDYMKDENVIEFITANEYQFLENGKVYRL